MKYLIFGGLALAIAFGGWYFTQPQTNLAGFGDPFLSIQLATSPSNGNCLTTDGTNNAWGSCGTGGGAGSIGTTTPLVDTYVIYATGVATVGNEAAFTYNYNTNLLSLSGNASTTRLSVTGTGTSTDLQGNTEVWGMFGVGRTATTTIRGDNATSTFANALTATGGNFSTYLTAVNAYFTNVFIGADTLAEYISDTAGAFFTGNTETGIVVTYQDADNTVDVVCDTASGSAFGCLSAADWTTFNNKQDTITAGDALTLTGTDIDFDGGTAPSGELGGTWGSITIDDSVAVTSWNLTTATLTTSATVTDDDWIGLGSGAGRIDFDDLTVDEVNVLSANVGIGTTTPQWLTNIFSATAPQLVLSSGAGFAQWAFRNVNGTFYLATTTLAGTATSSPAALTILNSGNPSLGIASSSFNGMVGLGPLVANGSTTVSMGKLQWDGYDAAGARRCVFLNAAGSLTVVAGACTP